jgi:hypothetical protein
MAIAALLTANAANAQTPPAHAERDRFPANAPAETLLHIAQPGRYAIRVHSATGTAIDLIDMITGPTDPAGAPGSTDGRLDLLLDSGTYKLRLHPAAGAQGDITLHIDPFTDAAPAATLPADSETDATLTDFQQRSFWFTAAPGQTLHLEAAGRALADFRLWRNGRDLMDLTPTETLIEPTKGHPLHDLLITATIPAGVYRATAYGGPALPWADGTQNMPFHLRGGAPDTLRLGWAGGQIGPFGSQVYRAAGTDTLFRLYMEGPATLFADGQAAEIDKRSRIPQAEIQTGQSRTGHWIEIHGPEHTPFQIRALRMPATTSVSGPGDVFLTANTSGFGGDSVPATLVLAKQVKSGFTVIGSTAPEITPGTAWRRRFNLAGPVSILFHAPTGGKIAATLTGVPLDVLDLTALDSLARHPPIAPETPGLWNIPAGWYELLLIPHGAAAGIADLTIGTPGVTTAIGPPGPDSPAITFGTQSLAWEDRLRLFGNTTPGGRISLDARPTPVDLDEGPLRIAQQPGESLTIPIKPGTGTLTATEFGKGPVPVTTSAPIGTFTPDTAMAELPAPDHPRLVALSWKTPPAPAPIIVPEPEAARPTLAAGTQHFIDLANGQPQSFTLTVATGGLMRVETLGRLRTTGAIGTNFIPELNAATANGVGQNMLLQGFLRAGSYRVDVTAENSAGHTGITAAPAPLLATPTLLPGGTVRATMQAGSGLAVPIAIAAAGSYRIELLGQSRQFTARLEDSGFWPFAAAAPLDTTTQDLAPGLFRLLVLPETTDARAVIRLTRLEPPPKLTGHGPHPLPFDSPQSFTWREPAGRADPRVPDSWRFTLAAPADITLSLTDGMQALFHGPDGHELAHIVGGTPYTGHLPQGTYQVEATSQGRNDRLDYTLTLSAKQLQPGIPRAVPLPATLPFALATDRVVSLTSFGATPIRATLRDAAGQIIQRAAARDNDWNIAISRPLPAGAYTLLLESAATPAERPTPPNINDRPGFGRVRTQDGYDDSQSMVPEPPAPENEASGNTTPPADATEIILSLPDELPTQALSGPSETLSGGGIHRLSLPQPAPGQLILAGAASSAAIVLSLEQLAGQTWQSRALAQGTTPILALPAGDTAGPWRLSAWPVDGGSLPITLAARTLTETGIPGRPHLLPTPLPGVAPGLMSAHVSLPSRAILTLAGAPETLAGAWPGHEAVPAEAGLLAPQSTDLWLVSPGPQPLALKPLPPGAPLTITLQAGARAALPRATFSLTAGPLTAWIAEASGQPGLSGTHGMGVADQSALTLVTTEEATAWNAADGDALRLSLHPVPLATTSAVPLPGPITPTLPAASATPITLPPGLHRLHLDLPPGTAAIAGWPAPDAVTIWSGRSPVSRTIDGSWTRLLLVNTTSTPAPVALSADDLASPLILRPGHAEKRFFGAGGSVDMQVQAKPGQTLVVAGAAHAVFLGNDGSVRRGRRITLSGPGRVTLDHSTGLVALWLEGQGATPWPTPAALPVRAPAKIPLSGEAMLLDLAPAGPALLRLRSTAPVILAVADETPALYPSGAAISRYLPPGPATLRIISPQDGPLSGSLDLTTTPLHTATEGLGETVTIAPGDAALFAFTLRAPGRIGAGVRAQPDRVTLRLLTTEGHTLATGAALLRSMPAGSYVLEASVPPGAPTSLVRPAIIGIVPKPNGPPADVVRTYLEKK